MEKTILKKWRSQENLTFSASSGAKPFHRGARRDRRDFLDFLRVLIPPEFGRCDLSGKSFGKDILKNTIIDPDNQNSV